MVSASIEPARSVILPLTAAIACRSRCPSYLDRSAVVDTAVVFRTCFEVCVDRFHHVSNVTPGLLNVDDSGVLESGFLDE